MLVHGEEIALRCDHILFRKSKFQQYVRLPSEGAAKYIDLESLHQSYNNEQHENKWKPITVKARKTFA